MKRVYYYGIIIIIINNAYTVRGLSNRVYLKDTAQLCSYIDLHVSAYYFIKSILSEF